MLSLLCIPQIALTFGSACATDHSRSTSAVMQGNLFKIIDMPGGKASALMEQYKDRIANMRANGFQPNVECWMPDRQPQIKQMGTKIRAVSMLAKAAGTCSSPLAATDPIGSDPESERVARTKATVALAATGGTAIALVSHWPDHVSIDACVCSPAKLAVGEVAEKAVIKHVTELALERGVTDIRLVNSDDRFFQLYGNAFYEPCGFYPPADASADGSGTTVLSYRTSA